MTESSVLAQAASLFTVRSDVSAPVFQQLHASVVAAIQAGHLVAGQQLPTVRALAETLSLAPNTVAKAYKSLEHDGVIEGRGRAGTFVRGSDDPLQQAAEKIVHEAVTSLLHLGVPHDLAAQLLAQGYQALGATAAAVAE